MLGVASVIKSLPSTPSPNNNWRRKRIKEEEKQQKYCGSEAEETEIM
jgi:hypothetical protein